MILSLEFLQNMRSHNDIIKIKQNKYWIANLFIEYTHVIVISLQCASSRIVVKKILFAVKM